MSYSLSGDAEEYEEFGVEYAAFSENEYRLLLINVDDEVAKEAEGRRANARCLIIRPVDNGTEGAFEKVGLGFLEPKSSGIVSWERHVVTLF